MISMIPVTGDSYCFIFIGSNSFNVFNGKLFREINAVKLYRATNHGNRGYGYYYTIWFYVFSHIPCVLRNVGNNRIVVGQESLAIRSVSAIVMNGRSQGDIRIHVDGLAHPDVVHFVAGLAAVAECIVGV